MAEEILGNLKAANMFDLTSVVAVVTGGGTGIGMMISSTLLSNGATVYIIGPKQEDLDRVVKPYNDAADRTNRPGRMYGIEGDIRKKSEAKRLAEVIGKRSPYVTVLFNNAGILEGQFNKPTEATASAFVSAFFDDIPEESFSNSLATNAVGPYWLTFAFLPLLEKWKESGYGNGSRKFHPQVIMTSSMNGWTKDLATAGSSYPYAFSKSAIGHATSSLAHELLPLGVRVNGIAPGLFTTSMSTPGGKVDEFGRSHNQDYSMYDFQVPTRPLPPSNAGGTPRDMGSLVLFLVSNEYVNGETVLIDGGTLLAHPSSY
ncbi:hypothetical protein NLI96_g4390 [Meripilus lineatus]|uniref:NAD(P)-binding protein n=1 Tax=Meripilus lineatus TaxID=2056292 RepID=A0AAD5YK59_9APHY|nr:hypothetical protein NLI96_g4390 [Physisporinus lineatus]